VGIGDYPGAVDGRMILTKWDGEISISRYGRKESAFYHFIFLLITQVCINAILE